MTPTKREQINDAGAPRKQYETPRLEIFGNIHQITQAAGSDGRNDGGSHPMNKTG